MKMIEEFKQFVEEINLENGRNYKISVLEKYKNNDNVKYILHYLLNPYIVTGISEKKLQKLKSMKPDHAIVLDTATVKDMLTYISMYNTGADNYLETMKDFTDRVLPEEYHDLFYKIITKNVILGVDTKTVNKVMPKLIPTFNVMLANKYFDKPELVEGKKFAITTKIDGMRCIMLKKDNKVTFWSRQGQKIEGLVDLEEEAKYFPNDICLDGELIADVGNPDTYKDTMKRARNKDAEKHGLKMMVFDYMPIEDFETQTSSMIYTERRFVVEDIFDSACLKRDSELRKEGSYLRGCDTFPRYFDLLRILYEGTDTSEIIEWLNDQTEQGEEGVMINICDALYDFKRTNNLLKVKKFQDTEVKVIGFQEGTNKYTGTLGALVCEYKYSTVDVGSGFSDVLRDEIWANKDAWLGKTITVKYFEETYNSATGMPSLRFPVFIRVREDI